MIDRSNIGHLDPFHLKNVGQPLRKVTDRCARSRVLTRRGNHRDITDLSEVLGEYVDTNGVDSIVVRHQNAHHRSLPQISRTRLRPVAER